MKAFLYQSLVISIFLALPANAVMVSLPNEQELEKRISSVVNEHFVEKTMLTKKLANRKIEAIGVALAVHLAIYDYIMSMKNEREITAIIAGTMIHEGQSLIRCILKHSPEAIHDLEQKGLLKEPVSTEASC